MDGPGTAHGLAVVIPAGPADDIEDTLSSVLSYTEPPREIVILDDLGRPGMGERLDKISPDVHVLPVPEPVSGVRGKLWINVAAGIQWAARHLEFAMLLRLDADALLVGPGLASAAAERFAADPSVGLLGSNRLGMDGRARDWTWAAATLGRECGLLGMRRPALRRRLRHLRLQALANGYVPGEHPLGAAYLLSVDAVRSLDAQGLLDLPELSGSTLCDDHLVGLLAVAAGYRIGEFAGPDDPLALDWKQLPASPEELLARRKLVVHSVRRWQQQDEREVRAYFALARARASAPDTSPDTPKPC